MKRVFMFILATITTSSLMATVIPHYGIEAGYDRGIAHVRSYDIGHSWFFNNGYMDGFHIGGNVQLDFSTLQHVPGLVVGVNYEFLAKKINNNDQTESTTAMLHTLQVPIRFNYTYQVNNQWRIIAQTGPQVRVHLGLSDTKNVLFTEEMKDRFDMSWGFAFGFGWEWLSLNISYDLGMIDLIKRETNVNSYYRYNSDALAVTLGFRIK